MAWNVSSCSSGDTRSAARSMISSCERVFSGPWGWPGGGGWAWIRALTQILLARASPHLPSKPPHLAQTGSVRLEGVQLGQDCVSQLGRVLWAPGRGMADKGP